MTFQAKTGHFEQPATVIEFPKAVRGEEVACAAGRKANQLGSAKSDLRRPPTLIRAAKWRAARYQRGRDLPRLASGLASMRAGSSGLLARLMEIEDECWRALKDGASVYTPERHVLALAAVLAERRPV